MRLRIARKIAARVSRQPLSAPTPYTDAQEGQAARRLHRWWCSRPPAEEGGGYPEEWYARNRLASRARRRRYLQNIERRRRGEEEVSLPPNGVWGSRHPFARRYR